MAESDLKWSYDAGADIWSGIVVGSDDVIYFGTKWTGANFKVIALNSDGSFKWEYIAVSDIHSGFALSNDESVVYCGDLANNLLAIYTATGLLKWSYTDVNLWEIHSGITVDSNDKIYFGDRNGWMTSLNYDGTLNWQVAIGESHNGQKVKGTVIYVVGTALRELNLSDGSENWNFPQSGEGTGVSVASDGTIYYGSESNNFYAINPDGSQKWNYPIANYGCTANAIGSDGNIRFVDCWMNTKLICLDPDGNLEWEYPLPASVGSGVAATGLGLDSNDITYVGCHDNKLHAVNKDGTFRWSYATGNAVESGIAFSIIASPAESTVYFGSDDNFLYALEKLPAPAAEGGGSSLPLLAKLLL